jgi:hypothetical protein
MEIINRKMVTVHQEICTFTPAIINGAVYPINKHSSKPENNNELAITVMTDQIPSISDFLWVKFTKIQHERSQTTKHLNYFSDPSKPKPGLPMPSLLHGDSQDARRLPDTPRMSYLCAFPDSDCQRVD